MGTELFEPVPRWIGAPSICIAANLPAFEDRVDLLEYLDRICPRWHAEKVERCEVCKGWHAHGVKTDPSGGSSGTGRSLK